MSDLRGRIAKLIYFVDPLKLLVKVWASRAAVCMQASFARKCVLSPVKTR